MIEITGQDPVHKHIFSTLLNNARYDVSIKFNTVHFRGANDNGSFSREIKNPLKVEPLLKAVKDYAEDHQPALYNSIYKQFVLIEIVGTCVDLRVCGSNLDTGRRAVFHVKGKNQGYKIYMTNNGNSLHCYIKQKGKNKTLFNDRMVGSMSPHKLTQLIDWYFEK